MVIFSRQWRSLLGRMVEQAFKLWFTFDATVISYLKLSLISLDPGTTSARESIISTQLSPTRNAKLSQISLDHQKEEVCIILFTLNSARRKEISYGHFNIWKCYPLTLWYSLILLNLSHHNKNAITQVQCT